LGIIHLNDGLYDSALVYFRLFRDMPDAPAEFVDYANANMRKAKYAMDLKANPVPFKPINVGDAINSSYDEYYPSLTVDNKKFLFTRAMDNSTNPRGKINEDVFESIKVNGRYVTASLALGELNSKYYNEGAITVSPDGQYIIFTGCNWEDGLGRCDLYTSEFRAGRWTKPVNLGEPVNTRDMETQPSLSFDGNTLYFASNRPGSTGEKRALDIWMSKRGPDGKWQKPVNLGPNVNTEGTEQSPFIHPDDRSLYFSSDTHKGMGGKDLFLSRRTASGSFGPAENLGYPINDHQNQFSLFISADAEKAYFASERSDSRGGLDIYSFDVPRKIKPFKVSYLNGTVYNHYTKEKLEAKIELTDVEKGEKIIDKETDESSGKVLTPVPTGREYAITISKPGYMFHSDNISLKGTAANEAYDIQVGLKPIKVGEKVVLKNIFFEFDSYNLQAKSKVEVGKLVDFMKQNPKVQIEIGGHTDSDGSDTYNQKLSEDRANSVKQYILSNSDLNPDRLTAKGYGESEPIATNNTEEGKALNRRTEFKVIGM